MKVTKLEDVTGLFSGIGDLFVFNEMPDYAGKSIKDFTNPKSLGQIVQDSTSWDGEDPEVEELKDEQGNIITAKTAAGTLAFSFDLASTSALMLIKFLKGENIKVTDLAGSDTPWTEGTINVTGFGDNIPVVTLPVCIVNDEKTKTWFYPKTKITSSLKYDNGLWQLHCSCIAEYLSTGSLKTGMLIESKLDEE